MANEISLTCKSTVSKGGTTITNATSTKTLDMAGDNMFHAILNLTNALEQIDTQFTDIYTTNNYWLEVRNPDATATVTLYLTNATTYPISVVPPGCFALVQVVGGKTVYAVSSIASSMLEVLAWEV